jgi:hypothetical protein
MKIRIDRKVIPYLILSQPTLQTEMKVNQLNLRSKFEECPLKKTILLLKDFKVQKLIYECRINDK